MGKAASILTIIGFTLIGIAAGYPLFWAIIFNTFENGISDRLTATCLLGSLLAFVGCIIGFASSFKD